MSHSGYVLPGVVANVFLTSLINGVTSKCDSGHTRMSHYENATSQAGSGHATALIAVDLHGKLPDDGGGGSQPMAVTRLQRSTFSHY